MQLSNNPALPDILAYLAKAQAQAAYYSQDNAPVEPNTFLKAAKRGEFPSFRPGKKLVARVEDVHRWIERNPAVWGDAPDAPTDEIDSLLASGGLNRAA